MEQKDLALRFPHLFKETIWPWGPTKVRFVLTDQIPPANKISNVNIVPHIGDQWIVIKLADGMWEIPGGTLEPGENYMDAIRRELLEEAGAVLISSKVIGSWDCFSLAQKPYRPHLPHPEFYRLVLTGEVKIISPPGNPMGGEAVVSVTSMPLETAVEAFSKQKREDLADLYQLAGEYYR